jgi:hypothetical protein
MAKNEEKIVKKENETTLPKMRQLVIETNGTDIHIKTDETSGRIELMAILQSIIGFLNQPPQK